jgi:hypothetical protein
VPTRAAIPLVMAPIPPTPALLDRAAVRRHLGLTRVDVERLFRELPVVSLPGSRKVYVRRDDLEAYLRTHTYDSGRVRPC